MHAWEALTTALKQVQLLLKDTKSAWLVGGSCGLLLQGVPLDAPPRDLDLYVDSGGTQELHQLLSSFSIDEQVEDRTAIYHSILSHYLIAGTKVELVGGFEVTTNESFYKVEVDFLSKHYSPLYKLSMDGNDEPNNCLRLMPLEHEFIFNILRNRPDRYEAIAAVMRSRQMKVSTALQKLIARNSLSDTVTYMLTELLLSEDS